MSRTFHTESGCVGIRRASLEAIAVTAPSSALSTAILPAICLQTRGSTRQATAWPSTPEFGAATTVQTWSVVSPSMFCAMTNEELRE